MCFTFTYYNISDIASCNFSFGSCDYIEASKDSQVVWKKGQHENAPDNDVMGNLSDFYSYLWSKQIQNSKWLPETEIRNLPIILL